MEDNQKLKSGKDALNEELNKLKSMNIQNMQDQSFALNRSIDHSDFFLGSTKKQEYSSFLKSSQADQNMTVSSCNSRSGKLI